MDPVVAETGPGSVLAAGGSLAVDEVDGPGERSHVGENLLVGSQEPALVVALALKEAESGGLSFQVACGIAVGGGRGRVGLGTDEEGVRGAKSA